MNIGILCPTKKELEPFIGHMDLAVDSVYAQRPVYVGALKEHNIVALVCGARKVNAAFGAAILIQRYHVDYILLSGIAGGLDRRLNICDVVIAEGTAYHDIPPEKVVKHQPGLDSHCLPVHEETVEKAKRFLSNANNANRLLPNGAIYFGMISSGDSFIDREGRDEISESYQSLCVDMETAAVAQICFSMDIPFFAVRGISDTEKEPGRDSLCQNAMAASHASFCISNEILRHCIIT